MKGKITIRISDSLRERLSEVAELNEVSVSELSRTILEQYFNSEEEEYDDDINENFEDQSMEDEVHFENKHFYDEIDYEDEDIVHSVAFFQLVTWVFDQRDSRLIKLDKNELKKFKDTIIEIYSSSIIKQELKDEFNKVFVDLIKEINSSYPFSYRPDFAFRNYKGFKYSLLTDFIFKDNLEKPVVSITI
tara:strand:- start:6353 stop:6922 length:570 start_codon:yes stop_codon:yes gene_type:complete